MKSALMAITLFLTFNSQAFSRERALGAHEHGAIKLGVAVENNSLDIDLNGPTESFINFEYLPKTDTEKKMFNDVKNLWEKNLFSIITPDKGLRCKIIESSFKQIIDEKETKEEQAKIKDPKKKEEGVHSDVEAKARVICAKDLAGRSLVISLKKVFKNIKKLNVEIISAQSKSVEIISPVQTVSL
jgi:hypothetical protein